MCAEHRKLTIRQYVKAGSLVGVILASTVAQAELLALDAAQMAQVTGQAGLTIDIETQTTIGEFKYVDAGAFYERDISFGGIGGGYADNIRAKIDISDGLETLATGFSDAAMLADMGFLDAAETDVAWALSEYDDGNGNFGKQYGDGDLVIHVSSTDLGQDFINGPIAGQEAANLDAFKNAVDFEYSVGSIGLQSSDGLVETDLSRNFSIEAYLGYLDIVITNRGNSFNDTNVAENGQPLGIKLQDSYLAIDLAFRVEDLDIDQTNNATNTFIPRDVTTPGLTLRDMRIHNERGGDTLGSFGYASFQSKMAAATGILHILESGGQTERVDGQAIYDINVKMDWDLPHISFGDTGKSIGEVYLTDFHIDDTSLVISAH